MPKFRISYYYLATGMEGRADEFPEKIIEANSQDEAIYKYTSSVGIGYNSFKEFMSKEKYLREWGITCIPMVTYETLVESFSKTLLYELKNNEHKGDIREFSDVRDIYLELAYHEGKLIKAIQLNDTEAIKEHLADCAIYLMAIGEHYNLY